MMKMLAFLFVGTLAAADDAAALAALSTSSPPEFSSISGEWPCAATSSTQPGDGARLAALSRAVSSLSEEWPRCCAATSSPKEGDGTGIAVISSAASGLSEEWLRSAPTSSTTPSDSARLAALSSSRLPEVTALRRTADDATTRRGRRRDDATRTTRRRTTRMARGPATTYDADDADDADDGRRRTTRTTRGAARQIERVSERLIGRDGPNVFFPSGVTGGRSAWFFLPGKARGGRKGRV